MAIPLQRASACTHPSPNPVCEVDLLNAAFGSSLPSLMRVFRFPPKPITCPVSNSVRRGATHRALWIRLTVHPSSPVRKRHACASDLRRCSRCFECYSNAVGVKLRNEYDDVTAEDEHGARVERSVHKFRNRSLCYTYERNISAHYEVRFELSGGRRIERTVELRESVPPISL
eukprot:1195557-Prorocentrum_minimum.AAC.3